MATGSDMPGVRRHAGEHLRRFVAARDRGDAAEMRRCWEELVIDFADRMDALVYLAHQGRLNDDEHATAVQLGLARFSLRLVDTFEGVSMGELVNACKTLARGICIDVQRAAVRRREREGISLDAGHDDEGGERPVPRWEADEAAERFARAERGAEATDFLAWALPQVKEDRRSVLVATFAGAELAEIADALAISRENAYQRRSRGMKDLARLKERYDE